MINRKRFQKITSLLAKILALVLALAPCGVPVAYATASEPVAVAWIDTFDGDWYLEQPGWVNVQRHMTVFRGATLRPAHLNQVHTLTAAPRNKEKQPIYKFTTKDGQLLLNEKPCAGGMYKFEPQTISLLDMFLQPKTEVQETHLSAPLRSGMPTLKEAVIPIVGDSIDLTDVIKLDADDQFVLTIRSENDLNKPGAEIAPIVVRGDKLWETLIVKSDKFNPGLYSIGVSDGSTGTCFDSCNVLVVPRAQFDDYHRRFQEVLQMSDNWGSGITTALKRAVRKAALRSLDQVLVKNGG